MNGLGRWFVPLFVVYVVVALFVLPEPWGPIVAWGSVWVLLMQKCVRCARGNHEKRIKESNSCF